MDGPGIAAREPPFELIFRLNARDYRAGLRKLRWRAVERTVAGLPAFGIVTFARSMAPSAGR